METASTSSQRTSDTDTNSQTAGASGNMKVTFKVGSVSSYESLKQSASPPSHTQ